VKFFAARTSETNGSIARSLYLEDGRWLSDYAYQAGQPIQQKSSGWMITP